MEVVGYAYNAAIHCPDCAYEQFDEELLRQGMCKDGEGNEVTPYWDTDETDTPDHCDDCGCYIDSSWTDSCQDYVMEALGEYVCEGYGNTEALNEWAYTLAEFYRPSYIGMAISTRL